MRRLAATLGAVALVASSPAEAQSTPSFGQAVSNSIQMAMYTQLGSSNQQVLGVLEQIQSWINGAGGCSGANWLCVAKALPLQFGSPFSIDGGDFGGGGASGSWDLCDFPWTFDASGNLLIPSQAEGAGPLNLGQQAYSIVGQTSTWAAAGDNYSSGTRNASSRLGLGSYHVHARNKLERNLPDPRHWYGIGFWSSGSGEGWRACSQAYYNEQGTLVGRSCIWSNVTGPSAALWGYTTGGNLNTGTPHKPCPMGSAGGADTYYYASGYGNWCVAYVKNDSLGAAGFQLSTVFPVPFSEYSTGIIPTRYTHIAGCRVSIDWIRQIAQGLLQKVGSPVTVDPEDVRTGGLDPSITDASQPAVLPPPQDDPTVPTPEPTPGATPTPTPTPSSPIYDPSVSNPDPQSPLVDWLPDIPSFSFSLPAAECPTYNISVPEFGWNLTLNSHCPLIEQNRAAIGAIMLLIWGATAAFIILRA